MLFYQYLLERWHSPADSRRQTNEIWIELMCAGTREWVNVYIYKRRRDCVCIITFPLFLTKSLQTRKLTNPDIQSSFG